MARDIPLSHALSVNQPAKVVRVAGLGIGAMLLSALPIYTIAALGPVIRSDLGLSRLEVGTLGAAVFVVAIGLSPSAGRLIDRFDARRGLSWVFAASGGALFGMAGFGGSYQGLVAGAAIGGVGVALANPATNRLIADHAAPHRKGAVTGFKQSGGQLAPVVAGALLPPAASSLGWRPAVAALALLTVVGLLLALSLPKSPSREKKERVVSSTSQDIGQGWLVAYGSILGLVAAGTTTHIPLFASAELGISIAASGSLIALLGIFGTVGRLALGFVGDSSMDSGRLLQVLAVGGAVSSGLIIASVSQGSSWLIAAVILNALSVQSWTVLGMLILVRGSRSMLGVRSGRVMTGTLSGAMLGPVVIGGIADATGSYSAAWAACLALSILAAVIGSQVRPISPAQSIGGN